MPNSPLLIYTILSSLYSNTGKRNGKIKKVSFLTFFICIVEQDAVVEWALLR